MKGTPKSRRKQIQSTQFKYRSNLSQDSFSSSLQSILRTLETLNDKIESSQVDIEDQFMPVKLKITEIPQEPSQNQIEKWLGNLARIVFSRGFKLYDTQSLNYEKTKSFCCENMIYNIMEFIKEKKVSKENIEFINECLKKNILPYLLTLYPTSESEEINLKFSKQIRKIDNLKDKQNDLVFKSGVKFEYSASGEYYSKIMQVLNYVINLPNFLEEITLEKKKDQDEGKKKNQDGKEKSEEEKEKERKQRREKRKKEKKENKTDINKNKKMISLKECFEEEVHSMFLKIFKQKDVSKMLDYDKDDPISLKESQILRDERNMIEKVFFMKNKTEKEAEKEYSEKVNSYTRYQIQMKIPSRVQPFTEEQIQNQIINIQNPKLLMILTRWCEQLEKNFQPESLLMKIEQFKMQDGSKKFIPYETLKRLTEVLQEQKMKIQKFKKQFLDKNYEFQKTLSTEQLEKQFGYLPLFECRVGLFNVIMEKYRKNYLIKYLNLMIHSLLKVSQKFYCESNNVEKVREQFKGEIPQLVTFKIDDLFRCKFFSKERQIIALYNEIERINFYHPHIIKIVKINNELNKQMKCLTINFLYRNKIMSEVKLLLNSEKFRNMKRQNKFHHFIKKLGQTSLNVVSEMSDAWITSDPRADFYEEKQKQFQDRCIKNRKQVHRCSNNDYSQQNFPFKCYFCQGYYYKLYLPHKKCLACDKSICIYCQSAEINKFEEMKTNFSLFQENSSKGSIVKIDDFNPEKIPEEGFFLSLSKKKTKPKSFISQDNIILTKERDRGNFKIACNLNDEKEKKEFLMNTVFVQKKQSLRQKLSQILFQSSVFPAYLKISSKEQVLIQNKKAIKDETIKSASQTISPFPTKKIVFNQNYISKFDPLIQMFSQVSFISLWKNNITQIPDNCSKLKKLHTLILSENKIRIISPNIGQLTKLKILNLSGNSALFCLPKQIFDCLQLEQIYISSTQIFKLDSNIKQLRNLKILEAISTQIKQFPKEISACKAISSVNLKNSPLQSFQLQQVDQKNFTDLKKFMTLDLSKTKIKQLTVQIWNCVNLKTLNLSECSIYFLPEEIGYCFNLEDIDLSFLKIVKLPVSFSFLQKLRKLVLSYTQIRELPEMGNFPNLTELYIDGVQEQNIIFSIGKCKNLKTLSLYSSGTRQIPQSLGDCWELEILNLGKTQIYDFPGNLRNLINLKHLIVEQSIKIYPDLKEKLSSFYKLNSLCLKGLKLKKIPQGILKLISLGQIDLSLNEFSEFPSQLLSLKNLHWLDLQNNKIEKLDKIAETNNIHFLNLKNNPIYKLNRISLKVFPKLRYLKINEFSIEPKYLEDYIVVK